MSVANELSFLPDDYLERKAQRRTNAVCAVLFCIVMGGVGGAFYISEKATKKVESEYTSIEQQYLTQAKRIQQFREVQEKQKRMSQQVDVTSSLVEKCNRSNILAEITKSANGLVSLIDFTLESKPRATSGTVEVARTAYEMRKAAREATKGQTSGSAAPAAPKVFDISMKLTGVARTDVQVAQFLAKVSKSPAFRDVNLIVTEEFKVNEDLLRKFQIEMMLDPNAESQNVGRDTDNKTAAIEVEDKK